MTRPGSLSPSLLLRPRVPAAEHRHQQAPPVHRRRCHRLRLRSRRPHHLLCPPLVQNQTVRPPARRHLAPGIQRQAPPPSRGRKIHPRQRTVHLRGHLLPLVSQRPPHPRPAPHHFCRRRIRQNRRRADDPHPRRQRQGTPSRRPRDRKSTRLNSSHPSISYAVFCLKKKKKQQIEILLTNKKKKKTKTH